MKMATFYRSGETRFGAIYRDTAGAEMISELTGDPMTWLTAGPSALEKAQRTIAAEQQGYPLPEVELRSPVQRPGKIVCVGLNYRSHIALLDEEIPEWPILFFKPSTSLIGSGQAIILPRISGQVDYEGELAVIIGRRGKNLSEIDALSHVAGYTCANDVSAHDIESRTSQWTSGKMLDTFCPLGPVITTADEINDPNCLWLRTRLNGELVQECCTSDMRCPVAALVSYVSTLSTLEPGDVILTGTPAGIGCMRQPQVFLQAGDRISVEIQGIGELSNPVEVEA
jgi:2-keto-4-pentenoate hydratase/2-oxohepta-3-ene-1,7-dioic acid hydratase in catechol pathway